MNKVKQLLNESMNLLVEEEFKATFLTPEEIFAISGIKMDDDR